MANAPERQSRYVKTNPILPDFSGNWFNRSLNATMDQYKNRRPLPEDKPNPKYVTPKLTEKTQ